MSGVTTLTCETIGAVSTTPTDIFDIKTKEPVILPAGATIMELFVRRIGSEELTPNRTIAIGHAMDSAYYVGNITYGVPTNELNESDHISIFNAGNYPNGLQKAKIMKSNLSIRSTCYGPITEGRIAIIIKYRCMRLTRHEA